MIKFEWINDYEDQSEEMVTYTTHAVNLEDVCNGFESFLKGMGFVFDGHVTIMEDE